MPQNQKNSYQTKTLAISLVAISLAACSPGTQTSNTEVNSTTSPPNSLASSPSPQVTSSSANLSLLGVKDIGEIKFITAGNSSGYFDTINSSTAATVEVPKATSVTATGWAILPKQGKPADSVILTSGENNSLVVVAPVNAERPDVVKVLKNSAYKNSGWSTTFDTSSLPKDKVVLKAWAYNSTSKEATQLNYTHEVLVTD